jgi:predicted TIM-barrel fold metal-dependent hydrolase
MTAIIDSDQHLYESRTCWQDNVDPSLADEALRIEDDDLGYPWLMWRDRRLGVAEVQIPGETIEIGDRRRRCRAGEPPQYSYDDVLPVEYWDPAARRDHLTTMGLDGAVLFPNFGLLWERRLSESLPALLANMGAWNRWTATVAAEGKGALNPVAHVTLRDLDWLEAQLHDLSAAGVRMAMMAPALVDGKPLSHPDLDRAWSAFSDNGIAPVFHVADQPRVFDDAWYTDDEEEDSPINVMESAFLWTSAAVACTDLIVNGKLEQHPDLRIGIVELSSIWVPQFLMMLDGGYEFTAKLNGSVPAPLSGRPSDYFRRQVRVSSFSYEQPARLEKSAGDLFMCCSDYPHSEGTAAPIEDYKTQRCEPSEHAGLFSGNVEMLLGV